MGTLVHSAVQCHRAPPSRWEQGCQQTAGLKPRLRTARSVPPGPPEGPRRSGLKLGSVLLLGLWLALGAPLSAGAQPTLPQGPRDRPCDQPAGAAATGVPDGHASTATVKGVDRQQGVVELATKDGRFLIATPPAETRHLREGDQLLVCLHGEGSEGEDRLADTPREAAPLPVLITTHQRSA